MESPLLSKFNLCFDQEKNDLKKRDSENLKTRTNSQLYLEVPVYLQKNRNVKPKFKYRYAKNVQLALMKRYTVDINLPSYKSEENKLFMKCSNLEMKIDSCTMTQQNCNVINHVTHRLFQFPDEHLYKEFPATCGHMKGQTELISVVLSSHAFYMIFPSEAKLKLKILYEDVLAIIVGSFARWLAIKRKILWNDCDIYEKDCYVHLEMMEPHMVMDFVKYLEIAIRRRLQTLFLKERWKDNILDSVHGRHITTLHKMIDKPNLTLSIGQVIDHLIPSVIPSTSKEIEFIEKFLSKQNISKIIKVLKCCLVYWENGSMAVSNDDGHSDHGPHMEGHLMIHLHILKTWIPAYFILKGGILYQYMESTDPMPHLSIELGDCCGCSRVTSEIRPYGFQVIRENEAPLLLAAPNEQIASQWLQAILQYLCFKDETVKRKYLPCQLIQTTTGLALTRQGDICSILAPETNSWFSNISIEKSLTSMDKSLKNVSLGRNGRHLDQPEKQEKLKSFRNIDSPKHEVIGLDSNGREKGFKETLCKDLVLSCPPTPPPLRMPAAASSHQEEEEPILKVLSFANYFQIAEILVDKKAKAAFVEFECSEAMEMALDWALYFSSETQLNNFIFNIENAIESGNEMVITYSTSGHISSFLQRGALDIIKENRVKFLFS